MTRYRVAAAAGAFLLAVAGASVLADPTSPSPAAAPAALTPTPPAATGDKVALGKAQPKKSDRDKVVCVTEEVTGSRLGAHRTCKTKGEWEQENIDTATEWRTNDERGHGYNPTMK